ncbi:MAG TPA: hypothetical protein VGW39_09320, partial [Chthoniobacterales bacterium]|nr:hypothetical protein [Chthoniobacterales bacterium]
MRELVVAATDGTNDGAATVGGFLLVENQRAKEVERAEVTPIVEPCGQDPNDLVGFAIYADNVANDITSSAEALLPATLANNNYAIVSGNVLSRQEIAAELRLDAE